MIVAIGGVANPDTVDIVAKTVDIFDGHTWSSGLVNPMPEAMALQCAIKLSERDLLVVGGMNGPEAAFPTTLFYDGQKNHWTKGPPMLRSRYRNEKKVMAYLILSSSNLNSNKLSLSVLLSKINQLSYNKS